MLRLVIHRHQRQVDVRRCDVLLFRFVIVEYKQVLGYRPSRRQDVLATLLRC